jgi:transposase InsO family protein
MAEPETTEAPLTFTVEVGVATVGVTEIVQHYDAKVSMDGRRLDNVFIERLCRSLKYEPIYMSSYRNLIELEAGIAEWMRDYNHHRASRP